MCVCVFVPASRYKKLEALAQNILAKNPNATEVLARLKQLKDEQDEMEDLWEKKNKELTNAKELQVCDSFGFFLRLCRIAF